MSKKVTDAEKEIAHPLEEVFDIEPITTVVPYKEVKTDLVPHEPFDDKDAEIEEQFQDLYDMALEAFENQQEAGDVIEAKFKARNAEVAVQYLKTALEAAREKRELKQHKDKITVKENSGGTVNNNLIMSHSEMMQFMRDKKTEDLNKEAIDGELADDET